MAFELTLPYIGAVPTVELSEAEYQRLTVCIRVLRAAYEIEEKLHLVLGNYEEFEAELLRLGLRNMLYQKQDTFDLASDTFLVQRRIANLLSSGHQYIDQTKRNLKDGFGRSHQAFIQVVQWIDGTTKRSLSFRLLWALRNQVQHHSVPIGFRWPHKQLSLNSQNVIATYVEPTLSPSKLAARDPWTEDDIKHLDSDGKGEPVSLAPYLREYVDLIGELHTVVRTAIGQEVARCETEMNQAREMLADKGAQNNEPYLLLTGKRPGGNKEELMFSFYLVEHRHILERRPLALGNFRNQVVTNAALD